MRIHWYSDCEAFADLNPFFRIISDKVDSCELHFIKLASSNMTVHDANDSFVVNVPNFELVSSFNDDFDMEECLNADLRAIGFDQNIVIHQRTSEVTMACVIHGVSQRGALLPADPAFRIAEMRAFEKKMCSKIGYVM
jgi:hypothetical protein